jgi:CO/xanthine dehydrogenase FAD-binding subunit
MTGHLNWLEPETVTEAIQMLQEDYKQTRIIAGGTDLLIQHRQNGTGDTRRLLSLHRIKELTDISVEENGELRIGAAVRIANLLSSRLLRERTPLLIEAAALIGCKQTRNQATIGGNIVNAAACADTVPPLIAHDAELLIQSPQGQRRLPLFDFIERPYHTCLKRDELLTAICIPNSTWTDPQIAFSKLGRRNALNITRISVAALLDINSDGVIQDARLTGGSVMPAPHRIVAAEQELIGKRPQPALLKRAAAIAAGYVFSLQSERWSTTYKRPVFENMVRDTLFSIVARYKESVL